MTGNLKETQAERVLRERIDALERTTTERDEAYNAISRKSEVLERALAAMTEERDKLVVVLVELIAASSGRPTSRSQA